MYVSHIPYTETPVGFWFDASQALNGHSKNFCLTAKRTEAPDDLKRERQGNKARVALEGWWSGMGARARGAA